LSADSGNETRENSPGTRQVLAFFLVALSVGVPALWLGGPTVGYFAFLLFGLLFVVFFSGDKRRLYLVIYLLLSVWLLVGGLTYFRLTSEETVAQISSLPLIGWLLKHTAVKVGVAVLTGLTGGLLIVGLPLFLIIFISAEWMLALRETYDLDRKLAMKLLFYLALGIGKAVVIVDEGEIKETKPKGPLDKFGAPAIVVVKPYNAVVLERGSQITRIEGAGLVTLQKSEGIKAVVDLRPQGEKFEFTALTKDNVPLTVSGSTSFRIERWQDARDRGDREDFETQGFTGVISGPYPVYRRTLYRAIYVVGSGADWKSQTAGMARGKVGAEIRGLRLDEIFVVDEDARVHMERSALQDIVDQAQPEAVKTGRIWGVNVMSVGIGSIEMPEEVQEEFLRRWGAPWRGWQALVEAKAESEKAAILATGKSRAAIIEAQGEHEMSRLQADGNRWKMVREALAKLEATKHEMETRRLIAQSERELAEVSAESTLVDARAQSESRRIRARASADAEATYFRHLAEALLETLGEEGVKELLVEMAKQRVDLDRMRKLISIVNYPLRGPLSRRQPTVPKWDSEGDLEEMPDEEE